MENDRLTPTEAVRQLELGIKAAKLACTQWSLREKYFEEVADLAEDIISRVDDEPCPWTCKSDEYITGCDRIISYVSPMPEFCFCGRPVKVCP